MDNYNQQGFSDFTVIGSKQATGTGVVAKKFMANVFAWMFAALGISATLAVVFATNQSLQSLMFEVTTKGMGLSGFGMLMTFAPLLFVLTMSFAFNRLSAPLLTLFFLLYAATTGISLSVVLLVYTSGSVITCFAAASAMFGVMAVMGYTTKQDLTSFGRIMMMGFIGIFIASIINWFTHSPL